MDDLVRWLGEQLDEDERIAREAEGDSVFDGTGIVVQRNRARGFPDRTAVLISPVATHVARHDPARVLREIDAKRRLLALYVEHERMDRETFEAEGDHARSLVSLRAAYLDAVRHHAAVYADRPGFRDEWRP